MATHRNPLLKATLLGVFFCSFGCSSSPTSIIDKVVVIDPVKERLSGDQAKLSSEYLGKTLAALNQGKLAPESLTAEFRRQAAPPRAGNADDKKHGYDILRMADYLRSINNGVYSDEFIFYRSPTGPYVIGEATVEPGKKDGYVLHLVPTDDAIGWRVNWLHRSPIHGNGAFSDADLPYIGPIIAATCFAECLLGGDLILAESLLAPEWKQKQHPEVVPADQEIGFNRPRLLQTLRSWREGAVDYILGKPDGPIDGPLAIDVVPLDRLKQPARALTLKLEKTPAGAWRITDVEANEAR
jgi:hypothetical protein